jgi:flavin-dependent dehydrogenase
MPATARSPRIAILGAGPSGTTLALHLVRLGIDPADLVLIDRAHFPRPKLCGGAVTFRGLRALRQLASLPPGGLRTTGLELRSQLGRFDVLERGPQQLYDRAWLDHQLVLACRARGVEVREGLAVTDLEPTGDGWRVRWGGGSQTFDWVAGCDGACGISRRAAGLRPGRMGRLIEGLFETTHADPRADRLVFDFDPVLDGLPGYAWIFPDPTGLAPGEPVRRWKLGLMDGRGVATGGQLRRWLMAFADRQGFRPVERTLAGWPEHYWEVNAQAQRPRLLLVGESMGIDPLLGEGLAPSMEMAGYAARRLRGGLDRGARCVVGYEAGFAVTDEGRNLFAQARLADCLYGRSGTFWLQVLFELPALRQLGAAGTECYGRLERRLPWLGAQLALHVATRTTRDQPLSWLAAAWSSIQQTGTGPWTTNAAGSREAGSSMAAATDPAFSAPPARNQISRAANSAG